MRDTTEILSNAIFQALNGSVSYNGQTIPVYDEKKKVGSTENIYILFSTQQEMPPDDVQMCFMNDSFLDIEIVHKTQSEVTKTILSRVANSILEILFPTPLTIGIVEPSGVQIPVFEYAGSVTRVFEVSPTESIVRKFIKVRAKIIQQS